MKTVTDMLGSPGVSPSLRAQRSNPGIPPRGLPGLPRRRASRNDERVTRYALTRYALARPQCFGYHRSMKSGPDIAMVAALVGDPARANMLTALLSGRALTASELAQEAGITPQTASSHLSKLEV